jgi:hypothetical protein
MGNKAGGELPGCSIEEMRDKLWKIRETLTDYDFARMEQEVKFKKYADQFTSEGLLKAKNGGGENGDGSGGENGKGDGIRNLNSVYLV